MQRLRFGTAERNINPAEPASLAGYFNARMWDHIKDDLHVRALVLEKDGARFGLVQFDLVTISHDFARLFHRALGSISGWGAGQVLLTATHTHTAPEIRRGKPGYCDAYANRAAACGAEALQSAAAALRKANRVDAAWREDRRFAYNRRYWMRNGRVTTTPPPGDPHVLKPEGAVDFGIPVVRLSDPDGRACILANISNHTDTLGGCGVSADWPGIVQERLRADFGADTTVFCLIGAAGNINHFDPFLTERNTGYAETRRIGSGYADTIRCALDGAQPLADADLRIGHVRVQTPAREIPTEERTAAEAELEALRDVPDATEQGMTLTSEDLARGTPAVRRYFAARLLEAVRDRRPRAYDLTGFRLDRWVVTSLPCEPFVELGLAVRNELFPGMLSMVVSHGNGTGAEGIPGGYIPNRWNFGRGGYETTVRSSPASMTTSERLREGTRELARHLCGP